MKKIIIGMLLLNAFSAFGGNPIEREEVRVLHFEATSYGALIKVELDTYCDDLLSPFCFGKPDKIKKETSCGIEAGVLVANVKITNQPSNWGNTVDLKRKNVKLKVDGLCQGRTPNRLIVNSHQIF